MIDNNSLTQCSSCGWPNSPYNTLCEKCHVSSRKKCPLCMIYEDHADQPIPTLKESSGK